MSTAKLAAIILIVAGAIGLAYGGFSYTSSSQEIGIGSLSVTVDEKRTVPVPVWAGLAAVLLGAGLLVVPAKGS
jgi:hypothetical protein